MASHYITHLRAAKFLCGRTRSHALNGHTISSHSCSVWENIFSHIEEHILTHELPTQRLLSLVQEAFNHSISCDGEHVLSHCDITGAGEGRTGLVCENTFWHMCTNMITHMREKISSHINCSHNIFPMVQWVGEHVLTQYCDTTGAGEGRKGLVRRLWQVHIFNYNLPQKTTLCAAQLYLDNTKVLGRTTATVTYFHCILP